MRPVPRHHMHHGESHPHAHDHTDGSLDSHGSLTRTTTEPAHGGPGHNRATPAKSPLQWQVPHRSEAMTPKSDLAVEPDLDKVEKAFVDAFTTSLDPTSFLRVAQVPFEAALPDGTRLLLLRVEADCVVDVGSIMPHLGGATFRYDPLPEQMVARRQRLRFIYFDGSEIRNLSFAQARMLPDNSKSANP
jgi:hypothetical protein